MTGAKPLRGVSIQAGMRMDAIVRQSTGTYALSFDGNSGTSASARRVTEYAYVFLEQLEPVYPGITSRWNGRATLSVPMLDPNLNCL